MFEGWIDAKVQLPEERKQVLVLVESGYVPPHNMMVRTAHYDPSYRPLSPWITDQGDCLDDYVETEGLHWREIPAGWL